MHPHRHHWNYRDSHPGPREQAIVWVAWRRLNAIELEQHILELMRLAGKGVHFNEYQWRFLDRMRRHLAKLQKEAA
jgi:hypothetical protein